MKCPACGSKAERMIYAGFPMWSCLKDSCNLVWGFWSWIMGVIGYNGAFMVYENMSYPIALWHWLTDKHDE